MPLFSQAVTASAKRWLMLVGVAGTLQLAACVSTETTRNVNGVPEDPKAGATNRYGDTARSDRSPNDPEEKRRRSRIRLQLSTMHFQQGNLQQALQEARSAVQIDPDDADAHGMLGLINMQIGEKEAAESSFRNALRLNPKDPELNNNFGWFLCQTGRQRESISYFDRAADDRMYQTPAKPLHNAGICLRNAGDDQGAENYLLKALEVDPANPVASFNLGELYLKQGNTERAKFHSDRLMSRYQPTSETLWLALRVARRSGDRDYASSLANQLRRRFPDSRETNLMKRGEFGG